MSEAAVLGAFEQGYLVAMLEADASIYSEKRPRGGRRAVIEFELGNAEAAQRIAYLLGVSATAARGPRPSKRGTIYERSVTYRFRLRGPRAERALRDALPYLTSGRQRVAREVLRASALAPS